MGKALPKICSVCSRTIKGSNWARHTKTHKGSQNITGKPVKAQVALKKGRPKKPAKEVFGGWKTVRTINRRGMALYAYKGTKLIQYNSSMQMAKFVRDCVN